MNNSIHYLDKVTGFVTRRSGTEILLFQHPNAGIQFPAGTVEENETLENAVLREVGEETGLTSGVRVVGYAGAREELPPNATHVIARGTKVFSRPDSTSFDWAAFSRGCPVTALRSKGGYTQVEYQEGDRFPDPQYLSYRITGWVPTGALASAVRRHFFHLEYTGESPERWQAFSDNHLFRPFWAQLKALPEIVSPQNEWLPFVQGQLGYSFALS